MVRPNEMNGLRNFGDARANASIAVALLLVASTPIATSQNTSTPFPAGLDPCLWNVVRLTAEEQRRLAAGKPVTRLLDGDQTRELAVFGALWINAPIRRYVDALKDIENFERGGKFKYHKANQLAPAAG